MLTATNSVADLALFDLTNNAPGQFLRLKRTMIDLSHAVETAAAQAAAPGRLFAGFQRFSFFAREAGRYAQLTAAYNGCWIFGVADVDLPAIPGVTPIAIPPHSPLASEWFVIADGPAFGMALLTADTNGFAIADNSRRFMGILTADTSIVRAAATRLTDALDIAPASWTIDPRGTLRGYEVITNYTVGLQEERAATRQARSTAR